MARIAGKLSKFSQKEITELFKQARAIARNRYFNLLIIPQSKEFGRMLLVVPRRVGTSPERNKLKRRLRSIFYEEQLFEHGHDCIIIFKKAATALSFEKLKQLILEAFTKIEI